MPRTIKNPLARSWCSIDPGIEMGVACWYGNTLFAVHDIAGKGKTWQVAADDAVAQAWVAMKGANYNRDLRMVACEWPQYFNSSGGRVSAQSGSLLKLVTVCGRIEQIVKSEGWGWKPVPVNQWKGQWKKEHVISRVTPLIPEYLREPSKYWSTHQWEAAGLGYYLLGDI